MNIKFSMPELLILFSLFMYPQSFTFAVAAFCFGLLGRIIDYLMEYSVEMKKAESAKESVNEAVDAFTSIFNAGKKEV
tara:strand:+ start:6387 stop:6620 length:234 start_codon:yes stop_codon:yes gene_type:complete